MTVTIPGSEPRAQDSPINGFETAQQLAAADLEGVDRLILRELSSDVALINQIGHYIVASGGKRLRPLLLLLAAKSLGYNGTQHLQLAAIIEFIHTATLLHDDVVDESVLRRGKDTANAVWGNAASVLVGDFLYSRAFEMMVATGKEVGSMRIMEIMSGTTTAIAEGEVLQLLNCNNPETSESTYLQVISRKTAILFSAATQLAAILVQSDPGTEALMSDYGMHLGIAFQLVDDALDYRADEAHLGKNLGDDLAEGKPTLPLIHAMQYTSARDAEYIRTAIRNGDRDAFEQVYSIIESTQSIAYTVRRAEEESEKAIAALAGIPASPYREALEALARFSVQRLF